MLLPKTHRFAGFAVLKAPDVPSALIELGYLSNPTDERLLREPRPPAPAGAGDRARHRRLLRPRRGAQSSLMRCRPTAVSTAKTASHMLAPCV